MYVKWGLLEDKVSTLAFNGNDYELEKISSYSLLLEDY